MDPVKILKRAWYILWNYRALWVFGLVLALAAGSSYNGGSNNGAQYHSDGNNPQPTPQSMQEAFRDFQRELNKLFEQGIPDLHISGKDLTTFLWVIGAFILVMLVIGIVAA